MIKIIIINNNNNNNNNKDFISRSHSFDKVNLP